MRATYNGSKWSDFHSTVSTIKPVEGFERGQRVRVSVSSGFSNVPNDEWDSVVQSTTIHGNVYVLDQYGYPFRVSPACLVVLP